MVTTAEYTDMAINTTGQAHGQSRTPRVAVEVLADAVLQLARAVESLDERMGALERTTRGRPGDGRS